jgi:RNA polymerase sigma factor for flagellar operon FliA
MKQATRRETTSDTTQVMPFVSASGNSATPLANANGPVGIIAGSINTGSMNAGLTDAAGLDLRNTKAQTDSTQSETHMLRVHQNSAYQDSAYERDGPTLAPHLRDALILEHLPQVRLIARRIHDRLPESVALDDLISTGVVGLISAIDRFDSAHNVKLKTYAEYKIRGAILDSLRGLDWAPRQQRKRAKQIEAAIANAERRLHRTPNEDEIAQELGLKLEAYHEWLVEIRGLNLGSLENASADEDSRDLLKFVSDDEEAWPSRLLERSELKRLLAEAISKMPDVEKTVLGLYYHEELTLREISKILKLHESRISS